MKSVAIAMSKLQISISMIFIRFMQTAKIIECGKDQVCQVIEISQIVGKGGRSVVSQKFIARYVIGLRLAENCLPNSAPKWIKSYISSQSGKILRIVLLIMTLEFVNSVKKHWGWDKKIFLTQNKNPSYDKDISILIYSYKESDRNITTWQDADKI